MNIRVKVDTKQLERRFGMLAKTARQSVANAINRTAEDVQKVQRAHQRTVFQVRRPTFVDRAVKIKPFARRNSLFAVVSIDPPGGQARASVLTQHEQGGQKRPQSGSRLAVPIEAPKARGSGRGRNRFRDLQLQQQGGRIIGQRRTFMIRPKDGGDPVVLQKVGRGKRAKNRLLYTLERSVRLTPRLRFIANANSVVRQRFPANLKAGITEAINRARKA